MEGVKDTVRALVRIDYAGQVHKTFRGHQAKERFENELHVLRYLEKRECPFVPRVIESDPEKLMLITTHCGKPVEQISHTKLVSLFTELESFGVRHDDQAMRNVTYSTTFGRFFLIDFEFATILDDPHHHPPQMMPSEKAHE
ncbi:MAG: serine/threonine protein phosphatase [Verrucomicrobiota bacterium]